MSSDMVSDSTASVQDQVTGTVNVAKLVYASTGALQTRVIEINDDSGKAFVYNCEGVSSDITSQGTSYNVQARFPRLAFRHT
ncbi:hypothetical protein Pmar_PMAR011999 [Perkinsus marinus ATCC 50983]|uniref:Uncharacterized protein n=1 Tax=Perkinsus marinus (strain ATCC 50983 / TXsc) TaxID=423536 RepID=C5LEA2_PERM5|nr:hypothetical protein Pmar_PMAR011999 [Perkinsus marinus ATCC 50983]EER04941.1 hypothetical protein Pmar_PMAR011999 [Perkinsus marinus ATCC 50983]|eukprot:XP_002773125.1 hypothetical protein Pmar_PMAR011999 [Perkinsus marinus ATCC 50983]